MRNKKPKIVIWGYNQDNHTQYYIHWAWHRTFKYLGYETYWFSDDDHPTDFDYGNCLFIAEGYRDNNMDDFSEVSSGIQMYGSQGGEFNGQWVPRPIKMDGKVYFFKTPKELYNDQNFLNGINLIRTEVGLPPLESYVQNMQKYV